MIVETSGWRHLKEKNKFFLSCEYQKMCHPRQEMAQLLQIPQIKIENLFLPCGLKSRIT